MAPRRSPRTRTMAAPLGPPSNGPPAAAVLPVPVHLIKEEPLDEEEMLLRNVEITKKARLEEKKKKQETEEKKKRAEEEKGNALVDENTQRLIEERSLKLAAKEIERREAEMKKQYDVRLQQEIKKKAEEDRKAKEERNKKLEAEKKKKEEEKQKKKEEDEKKKEEEKKEREAREADELAKLNDILVETEAKETVAASACEKKRLAYQEAALARNNEKEVLVAQEQEERTAIEELKRQIEEREKRLAEIKAKDEESEARRATVYAEYAAAATHKREKEKLKLRARRNIEMHASNQKRRFSRLCTICTNPNPVSRASMTKCGHVMCYTCAEEHDKVAPNTIACPFCRERTSYVRMFENQESEVNGTRKRKHEEAA